MKPKKIPLHSSLKKSEISSGSEQYKPKHMHRRTISKTSDELLASLKLSSPEILNKKETITPQQVIDHIRLKEEHPESHSDEETNIRSIIEQRKAFSPIVIPS